MARIRGEPVRPTSRRRPSQTWTALAAAALLAASLASVRGADAAPTLAPTSQSPTSQSPTAPSSSPTYAGLTYLSCPTPLVAVTVSAPNVTTNSLMSMVPGENLRFSGAIVQVMYSDGTQVWQRESNNFGYTYPTTFLVHVGAQDKLALLTATDAETTTIALGYMQSVNGLASLRYNAITGYATNTAAAPVVSPLPTYWRCGTTSSRFVCVVSPAISPSQGFDVYHMLTDPSPGLFVNGTLEDVQPSNWTKVDDNYNQDALITVLARPGIAFDGTQTMIAATTDNNNVNGIYTYYSIDLVHNAESYTVYTLTAGRPLHTPSVASDLFLASSGVNGSFIVAYTMPSGQIFTQATSNLGTTWIGPMPVYVAEPGFSLLAFEFDTFQSLYVMTLSSATQIVSRTFNANLMLWPNQTLVLASTTGAYGGLVSVISGDFFTNYAAAAVTPSPARRVVVDACVPTLAPTAAPVPTVATSLASRVASASRSLALASSACVAAIVWVGGG